MEQGGQTLGLIAGGGQFPMLVAEAARRRGLRVVAVAHQGETDVALQEKADQVTWVRLGQLGRLLGALKAAGVSRAVMAGTIRKRRMFEGVRPDLRGLALMTRMAVFHDDEILKTVAREFASEGIEIVSSTEYLGEMLAPRGCLTRRRPSRAEREDIRLGWRIAKELGRLDVGQCAVVRQMTVLALEAIDGTDETILRGAGLAGEKAVVVKVSKPDQDLRFDVPSVGRNTIRVMAEGRASVLAVEAGKTILFDRSEMVAAADAAGISIVGYEEGPEGTIR